MLDELAAEWPTGTRIRYRAGTITKLGMVHGVTKTLPAKPGEPWRAGLVVESEYGIGCVLPEEIVAHDKPGQSD